MEVSFRIIQELGPRKQDEMWPSNVKLGVSRNLRVVNCSPDCQESELHVFFFQIKAHKTWVYIYVCVAVLICGDSVCGRQGWPFPCRAVASVCTHHSGHLSGGWAGDPFEEPWTQVGQHTGLNISGAVAVTSTAPQARRAWVDTCQWNQTGPSL